MSLIDPLVTSLLVDRWQDQERAALVTRGILQHLWLRQPGVAHLPGALFHARITRRLAANLALVRLDDQGTEARLFHKKPIHTDKILVQITADAIENDHEQKAIECSTEIKLNGRFMIHLPLGADILVSKRLGDTDGRAQIRERFRQWGAEGGWIIRSSASRASDDQLAYEAGFLSARWRRIAPRINEVDCGLIQAAPPLAVSVIADYGFADPVEMIFADPAMAHETREWCGLAAPELVDVIRTDPGRPGPFELRDIEGQIDQLKNPVVRVADGGSLIFEKTSAFHVVDVNAGSMMRQSPLNQNKIMATELARQIRLRGLSGIILVDFLKMDQDSDRHALIEHCRALFAQDPIPTHLHGMTRLGLMEITRTRRDTLPIGKA